MKSVVRIGTETFSTHRKQEPFLKLPSHVGFTSIPTPGGNSQKFPTRYTGRSSVRRRANHGRSGFFIQGKPRRQSATKKYQAQSDLLVSPPLDTAIWVTPSRPRTEPKKILSSNMPGKVCHPAGEGTMKNSVVPEEENSFRPPLPFVEGGGKFSWSAALLEMTFA